MGDRQHPGTDVNPLRAAAPIRQTESLQDTFCPSHERHLSNRRTRAPHDEIITARNREIAIALGSGCIAEALSRTPA
jgi:hypothetical protein